MGKSETKQQEKVATQDNKGMDVPKEMSILSNRIQKLQSRIQETITNWGQTYFLWLRTHGKLDQRFLLVISSYGT